MRIYNWDTLQGFFNALNNNNVKYVVMRNFEEMDKDDFFVEGHEDIDILCENVIEFINASKVFLQNDTGGRYSFCDFFFRKDSSC